MQSGQHGDMKKTKQSKFSSLMGFVIGSAYVLAVVKLPGKLKLNQKVVPKLV